MSSERNGLRPHPDKQIPAEVVEVDVCCGCRPSSRRRFRKLSSSISSRVFRSQKFYDAQQAGDVAEGSVADSESLFYFDAEQDLLPDDEYPIMFSNFLVHPKPVVSMAHPETMLRKSVDFVDQQQPNKAKDHGFRRQLSAPIENHKSRSARLEQMIRRSTMEHQQELEKPRIKIPLQGYPGDLTVAELAECQKFLQGLKKLDPAVHEQVYSFRDVEEEPYTICRWLRATKFKADEILQRLKENQPMFEAARDQDFFPDVTKTIGAPFSVFLSQYPFLPIGRGKNGCPVNYFLAGKINPEGILSLSTPERLQGYFWWSFMYKFKSEVRKAQERDPDFVRIEGINILDMQGLSASALSSETIDVVKLASKVSDFFPETLHCMLIINAPGFFSMFWGLIKKFIDPRTAQRIQVFSNTEKAMAALRKLIDEQEIPVDYGGGNKSIKQAFMDEAADPLLKKQEIELLHIKRKGKGESTKPLTLEKDEIMEIRVYTRSVSTAKIMVELNGNSYATATSRCSWYAAADSTGSTDRTPLPNCTVVVEELHGPGSVKVKMEDLDDADKKSHSGSSRGYFLLVCDIKAKTTT